MIVYHYKIQLDFDALRCIDIVITFRFSRGARHYRSPG